MMNNPDRVVGAIEAYRACRKGLDKGEPLMLAAGCVIGCEDTAAMSSAKNG